MIASLSNARVKYTRRLQSDRRFREREGLFVCEGTRWLHELIVQAVEPALLFTTQSWQTGPDGSRLLPQIDIPVQLVTDAVMARLSDTKTPSGVLAVVPQPSRPLPARPRLLLILDQLNDPGNMGTIIRTAAAAAADGLLLTPGSVDPTNPKVVRATMGALLRLPVWQHDWQSLGALTHGMAVLLAGAGEGQPYYAVDWQNPTAVIIGNEAHGPGPEAQQLATGRVTIPLAAGSESLNAAVAAGILLFEAIRPDRA